LRPLGLTNGQFSLLMSLNRAKPASIGDISALLAMDRTTLTANLKPLERRGVVTVSVDHADKRSAAHGPDPSRPRAIGRRRAGVGNAARGDRRAAHRNRA
jgi:predicted ArsR family transcriptional regulator